MARLGNIQSISFERKLELLALAKQLDAKQAPRQHRWLFKCTTHQYFALYWNRQDIIRTKCWNCSHYQKDTKCCTYSGEPSNEVDVRLYEAAIAKGRINEGGIIRDKETNEV